MSWTLVDSSHPSERDRYEVATFGEYFAVSINGERPRVFHRSEVTALRWIAQRELLRASRAGEHASVLELVFANERGETTTSAAGLRSQDDRGRAATAAP